MHADDSRGRFFFFLGRRPGLVASFCRRQSVSAACVGEKNIDQPFPDGDGEERRDRAASYPAGGPANVRVRNRASPSPTMATGRTCRALPAFEALPACPELGEAA